MKKTPGTTKKAQTKVTGSLAMKEEETCVSVKPAPSKEYVDALFKGGVQMGDVIFCAIPVDMLEIEPKYQRIRCDYIQAIADNWDYSVCGSIKVNYRDGRLYVKDGQNRTEAARRAGIGTIMCAVTVGETVDREIDTFVYQNQYTTKITPYDTFYARWHKTDDTVAHELKALFDKYGIVYESVNAGKKYGNRYISRAPSPKTVGRMSCMTTVMREADYGHIDLLDEVFLTIKRMGWHTMKKAYSKDFIRAMLAVHRGHDVDDVRRVFDQAFKDLNTPETIINMARVKYDTLTTGAALNAFLNQFVQYAR